MPTLRYLLLQTRNADDPMAAQEVRCFARALNCSSTGIEVFNLISGVPSADQFKRPDMLLLAGTGHYPAAIPGEPGCPEPFWLDGAFDCLRQIHHLAKPTFASCWGFQAMARALGGECVNDIRNAELGTIDLTLTEAGRIDPVFGQLPKI